MTTVISFVLNATSFIIFWIIVPVIMVSLIFISWAVVKRTANGEHKIAAEAGFWGGFILFIIYFIYQLPSFRALETSIYSVYQIDIRGAVLGMAIGLALLLVLKKFLAAKMIGFVTMLLAFCGLASVYSYFFIRSFNDVILPAILGVSFAVLLYVVIAPKIVHELLDQKFR